MCLAHNARPTRRRRAGAGSRGRCPCLAGAERTQGQLEHHTQMTVGPCDAVGRSLLAPGDREGQQESDRDMRQWVTCRLAYLQGA